jgi:hypothetical protein
MKLYEDEKANIGCEGWSVHHVSRHEQNVVKNYDLKPFFGFSQKMDLAVSFSILLMDS